MKNQLKRKLKSPAKLSLSALRLPEKKTMMRIGQAALVVGGAYLIWNQRARLQRLVEKTGVTDLFSRRGKTGKLKSVSDVGFEDDERQHGLLAAEDSQAV